MVSDLLTERKKKVMDGTRAIQGGGTAGGSGAGGLAPTMDGLDIPTSRQGSSGNRSLAGWLNMLTHHRHHRRESFGFTDSIVTGIEDEDSNSGLSNQEQQKPLAMARKPSEADLLRSRNVSFSELTSPGGDGDLYFVSQFRRRTSLTGEGVGGLTLEAASASLQVTKGGVLRLEELEVDIERSNTSQLTTNKSLSIMEPIREGIQLGSAPTDASVISSEMVNTGQLTHHQHLQQPPVKRQQGEDSEGGLFLIDFEAVEEEGGNKLKLRPTSRKFGMSALFDTHLAQSWFFRNPNCHEDDENEEHHLTDDEQQHHDHQHQHPLAVGGGGLLERIQRAVADHPVRLRELNAAEPQGM